MPGLIGNTSLLRSLRPQDFTDERFGLPTVTDILSELEKPGRDPRPAFTTASFAEGVETLEDLAPGMVLEGVVTNVAAFGAFVDIGVHQDGLVHVSAMSRNFVSDPRQVVKPGDVVRVRVLGVDIARQRISLTLRLEEETPGRGGGPRREPGREGPAPSREPGRERPAPGREQGRSSRPGRGAARERGGAQRGGERGGGTGAGQEGAGRGGAGRGGADGERGGRDRGQGGGSMADALRRAGLVGDQSDQRPKGGRG
jgi:uncharacterized protein